MLKEWKHPECYLGKTWEGWLIAPCAHNRDSDLATESNWQAQCDTLLPLNIDAMIEEEEVETVQIVRNGHWACGWIEWIAIHSSNFEAVTAAEELAERLEEYPLLDEDDYSRREFEYACDLWAEIGVEERLDYIRRARAEVSMFSARSSKLPCDGDLVVYLTQDA
jgi:hypothetical protein